MTETTVVETEHIEFRKPLIITGFTGPGLIGPTALSYIVEKLKLSQSGYVKSPYFPPMIRIIKGIPQQPIRIYADKKRSLFFMISDTYTRDEYTELIGSRIFDWTIEKDASEIISINGMSFIDLPNVKHLVFGYSTRNSKYITHAGIEKLSDGVITGLDFTLLQKSIEVDKTWTTILTTTREVSGLDVSGVIRAVEIMNNLFKLDLNLQTLRNDFGRFIPQK